MRRTQRETHSGPVRRILLAAKGVRLFIRVLTDNCLLTLSGFAYQCLSLTFMVSLLWMRQRLLPHCVDKINNYCSKNKQSGSVCLERQRKMLMDMILQWFSLSLCLCVCEHTHVFAWWVWGFTVGLFCVSEPSWSQVSTRKLQVWNAAACHHKHGRALRAVAIKYGCIFKVKRACCSVG